MKYWFLTVQQQAGPYGKPAPFVRKVALENAVRPTPKKLTTGEQNLLKEFGLVLLEQNAPRVILERNRFSGATVLVNELESALYNKSMALYRDYERDHSMPVNKADRLKYLLLKINSEAYNTLLD